MDGRRPLIAMRNLTLALEKTWLMVATACLLAALAPLLAATECHQSEESSEAVAFEDCEVLTTKQASRSSKKRSRTRRDVFASRKPSLIHTAVSVALKPLRERDHHNGIGGFLIT